MTNHLAPRVLAAPPVAMVGAGQWAGVPFRTRIATHLGWVSSSKSRRYRVPVGPGAGRWRDAAVPAWLPGPSGRRARRLVVGSAAGAGHRRAGLISMVVPVEGPQLALLGTDGVEGQLREWGEVLAACATNAPRAASPASRGPTSTPPPTPARPSPTTAPTAARARRPSSTTGISRRFSTGTSDHRVYVTVTLSTGTARRRRSLTDRAKADYVTATVEQCHSIARELAARGYRVGRPLSPLDVAQLVRRLGDPWRPRRSELSAAERLGVPEENSWNTL